MDTTSVPKYDPNSDPGSSLILATTHSLSDFMTQISDIHQRLSKQGCHPVGRQGIFHLIGLVKFLACKWLNKIKYSDNEPRRIQLLTWALPTTYDKSKAKNELFSIESKDHITLQSRELIASLLVYWSNLHYELNLKAKTLGYHNIPLKDYLFWGTTVINSTIFSNHPLKRLDTIKTL